MQQRRQQRYVLLYSQRCPNCSRFLEGLQRTVAAADVALVAVESVDPSQLAGVAMVPCLVMPSGEKLAGSSAFEWLKAQESLPPEGFGGQNGALAFSDISLTAYADYTTGYSAFEPLPT